MDGAYCSFRFPLRCKEALKFSNEMVDDQVQGKLAYWVHKNLR